MASPPPAKKKKTDVSSPDTKIIDLEALKKKWSPLRALRGPQGALKNEAPVELASFAEEEDTTTASLAGEDTAIPAREGSLRGGDWILNKNGFGATISFFFMFNEEIHGLTVGHLVEKVGDPVFCFSDDTKLPNPLPNKTGELADLSGESYFMYEIGTVVSLSPSTDSMVFQLNGTVKVGPPLKLTPNSGVVDTLKLPDVRQTMPPPPLTKGTSLVGFGAQRRGAHGIVEIPSATINCDYSRKGNIGIVDPDSRRTKVTDGGDCGTIFVSLDGMARYFHHCGDNENCEDNTGPLLSYGYPVWEVMKSHKHLGGESQDILVEEEEDKKTQAKELAGVASPRGVSGPKKTLQHFHTKIVDAPPKHVERTLCNFNAPNLKIISGKNNTPVTLNLNTKAAKKN